MLSKPNPIVADGIWKQYKLGSGSKIVQLARRWAPWAVDERVISDFWALQDVSFRCEGGETVGIIGKNGAGKSTLLKVLCGVTQATRGTFSMKGRVAPLIEVGAGFHQELTGRENIFLNASIMGMTRAETKTKFDEIVDFSGLEQFIDTPVKRYSSGMLARLGFTIAVHIDPDVLLVDEVLSVGDLAFVLKSYRKVEEIRKRGIPVLLVSHNLQLIRNFCTRALWLHQGKLMAEGTPNDVCAKYTKHALDAAADAIAAANAEGDSYRVHSDESLALTDVKLLDGEGNACTHFETGGHLSLEMTVESDRPTGELIFFVTVWQGETGHMLVCQNNRDDGVKHPGLEKAGATKMTMTLPRLPFVSGVHQLSISISEDSTSNVADWHEKMFAFKVSGGQVGYGGFNAFPRWDHG